MNAQQAVKQYADVNLESEVLSASPHRLIQMLFEGAIASLNQALACIEHGDVEGKGLNVGRAIGIVTGLKASLNMDSDSALSNDLEELYGFLEKQLFRANLETDSTVVMECLDILHTLKSGWDGIAPEANS